MNGKIIPVFLSLVGIKDRSYNEERSFVVIHAIVFGLNDCDALVDVQDGSAVIVCPSIIDVGVAIDG